ncbi:MAG: DNA alkylation repair protein [Myxococcales bacterium]|nr:DNA alkylation repair protein [Myxococcales bacterium]
MTVDETMARLEALGDAARRAFNARRGVGDNQFGVKTGDVRKLAKEIKTDPELARALWATGNVDAQMLAILLVKPNALSAEQLDGMVRSITSDWVADWLNNYIVRKHPARRTLRESWMADTDPWAARSGWSLTAVRVKNEPDGLDLGGLLDRLEHEMAEADARVQWTMNNTLVAIGVHHPAHRERATAIGDALGIYRDLPVSKGCTSPFAPVWIAEMVRRQG